MIIKRHQVPLIAKFGIVTLLSSLACESVSQHQPLNALSRNPETVDPIKDGELNVSEDNAGAEDRFDIAATGSDSLTLIYDFPLDQDPEWNREGQWRFGQPSGQAGDPDSGFSGNNVFGYNLDGLYDNLMPQYALTTRALDCTHLEQTQLRFKRWLGIDDGFRDHARIEASTDNQNWITVWEHEGLILNERAWTDQVVDLSSVADGNSQVFIRWIIGPTDAAARFHGWNIDEIQIWAVDNTPPAQLYLLQWEAIGSHGGSAIALRMVDGYVESRNCGVGEIRVTFDEPLDTSSVNANQISIVGQQSGDVSSFIKNIAFSTRDTRMLVRLSSPLPDQDTYTISLGGGIMSESGSPILNDAGICISTVVGDTNASGTVNSQDLLVEQPIIGDPISPSTARFDVNCSGDINSQDLLAVRNNIGHQAPTCPVGGGHAGLPTEVYVDDDGVDQPGYDPAAPIGTLNKPLTSLQAAANVVQAGDTVFIRGGVYHAPDGGFTTPVLHVGRGGTANAAVRFESYQDEQVIFDAEAVVSSSNNGHRRGIDVPGNVAYVEISGLMVRGAYREGMHITGDHVTVEDCIVENCGLNSTNSESAGFKFDNSRFVTFRRCAARNCYNGFGARHAQDALLEDCLSYNNGVSAGGMVLFPENANGFQIGVARNGSDRVHFKRCVAFGNADDGWDASHSRDCTLDGCIAMNQNPLNLVDGDGGGFKVGNDQNEPVGSGRECRRPLVRYCFAIGNKANGIDPRDGIDGVFYNNTAYGNLGQFGFSTGATGHAATFYNNLSWGNQQQDLFIGDASKIADYNNWADGGGQMVPGQDQHSIRANPGFANPSAVIDTSWRQFALDDVRGIMPTLNHIRNQVAANFALTNTTPSTTSIDRGTFIATTTSGGVQTTQINVNRDPRRIFRIGDTIRIEGGATAIIQSMTASRIAVDRNVSFALGAGVHLNYAGSAPDAGAGEY